jgi:hypothetical protein
MLSKLTVLVSSTNEASQPWNKQIRHPYGACLQEGRLGPKDLQFRIADPAHSTPLVRLDTQTPQVARGAEQS